MPIPVFSSLSSLFQRLKATIQSPLAEAEDTHALLVKAYLKTYRDRLRKGSSSGKYAKSARLARYRFASEKTRKLAKKIKKDGYTRLSKDELLRMLQAKPRPSIILDALASGRSNRWKRLVTRKRNVVTPAVELRDFSFIEQPEATLRKLREIAELECEVVRARIDFRDDFCTDIAPYLVMAEMWEGMSPIFEGGHMEPAVQTVISAVRLDKALNMRLHATDDEDVWAFPLKKRRPSGKSTSLERHLQPQTREEVSDEFCDAVDGWLSQPEFGMQLSKVGRNRFGSIIGELLCNAERHSHIEKNDGSWSIAAFMARRVENGSAIYRCYMGFLSIGLSISDSMMATCNARTKADIEKFVHLHSSSGISPDTLTTLFAIQDGVTRVAEANDVDRGGVGFQDVLDMLNNIGGVKAEGRDPRMTIVSGRSCLRLRAPYIRGVKAGEREPRLLWCNSENSPSGTPDRAFVFDLTESFPGTIVGLAYTLDPEFLRERVGDGGQRNRSEDTDPRR
jgi:hypothetical protein